MKKKLMAFALAGLMGLSMAPMQVYASSTNSNQYSINQLNDEIKFDFVRLMPGESITPTVNLYVDDPSTIRGITVDFILFDSEYMIIDLDSHIYVTITHLESGDRTSSPGLRGIISHTFDGRDLQSGEYSVTLRSIESNPRTIVPQGTVRIERY